MRRLLLAAMMFGAVSGARAADLSDLPILRGSFPSGLSTETKNWDGWYAGGREWEMIRFQYAAMRNLPPPF